MTVLSVNVNKIAVLRNSRGGTYPSVVKAAETALQAGCGGITVHPRPDLRHIYPQDCIELRSLLDQSAFRGRELNIEGNPIAPATTRYPGLLAIIERTRPEQATLVPDGDSQITSDHGWRIGENAAVLGALIATIRAMGTRVSLFVDDSVTIDELRLAKELGAARIEIYTGPFAQQFEANDTSALARCVKTAANAIALGLGVNAGHDLSQRNLPEFLAAIPSILEVSIGHALIDEALYGGLDTTVRAYQKILGESIRGQKLQ
jgi:pyridoxine 5-phosphate synthase